MKRFVLCSMMLLCLVLSSVVVDAFTQYQIRDLSGVLGNYADPKDINNSGVIVGDASFGSRSHAFYWSEAAGCVDLGVYAGGTGSSAKAINESGRIVGFGDMIATVNGEERRVTHAMMWSLDGNVTDLGVLPGAVSSAAFDINDRGEILGYCNFETPAPGGGLPGRITHSVIWDQSGNIIEDLGPLFPGYGWQAYDINNKGDIRGYNMGDSGYENWIRHADGSYTLLEEPDGGFMSVDAMNDNGLVVGDMSDADHTYLATVWNPDGTIRSRLSPLAGDEFTCAYGINNAGVVAGESSISGISMRAVLWNPDGTIVNLSSFPGFELSRAQMVNDHGWVVGEAVINGEWATVLWTPVPEPSCLLALACGLGGFLIRKRQH